MTPADASGPRTRTRFFRRPGGEPPRLVDPRRWGALIGVVGGLVFVLGYAEPLGTVVRLVAGAVAVVLALVTLLHLYVRPASLGVFREPERSALLVYAGELAAIAAGSRLLSSTGHPDLRPALVAGLVGLHVVPFAWAFGERPFFRLGFSLTGLGGVGLLVGRVGVRHAAEAAEAAAVLSVLVVLSLLVLFARGCSARF